MSRISTTRSASVLTITLAHPPVNVIDIPMMEELHAALREAEADASLTTVVIRGAGKCFSAGVDIAAHTPEHIVEMLTKFHAFILDLANSRKVTVAVVHGNCLGGGAELALVCDIVYTETEATWGFPEIKLACYPPVACTVLAAVVGQKRAAELILSGASITGQDAMLIGLATACGSTDEVEQMTASLLEKLAAHSPAALGLTKKAMYAWNGIHLDKGLARAEKIYIEELMKTEDVAEGVNAWMEKRAPKWKRK